jgi:glycosyl transferase family 87
MATYIFAMDTLKKRFRNIPPHYLILSLISAVIIPVVLARYFSKHYAGMLAGNYGGIVDYLIYFKATLLFRDNSLQLYTQPGYIYPPPSVLLFLPLSFLEFQWAYTVHALIMSALMVFAIYLVLDTYGKDKNIRLETLIAGMVFLIGLAMGPVYQNLKGQINAIVLISCLGYLVLLRRHHPMAAAIVLSVGIWIKLYPVLLIFLGFRKKSFRYFIAGLVLGALFPLALLPYIPFPLYTQYFLERMAQVASSTNLSAVNQSISGFLTHLTHPPAKLATYQFTETAAWIRVVNLACGLPLVISAYLPFIINRKTGLVPSAFCLMAVAPVISPLGWEHAYLMAVPLCLYLLLDSLHWRAGYQLLFAAPLTLFLLPKIPDSLIASTCHTGPDFLHCLFYSRYLFIVLAFIIITVFTYCKPHNSDQASTRIFIDC